jgi:hypothetical protein
MTAAAALLASLPLSSSFGRNITFTLENKTDQHIVGFWATEVSNSSWGTPFSNTYVPAGGSQETKVNGNGCNYDFQVQFSRGKVINWRDVDFCVNEIMIYVDNDKVMYISR